MAIQECYQQLAGDFAKVKTRLPSDSLIAKFIAKFMDDSSFSDPIGTSYAELSVRSCDSRFQLNNYGSFDGMTIGVLKANSRNDHLSKPIQ